MVASQLAPAYMKESSLIPILRSENLADVSTKLQSSAGQEYACAWYARRAIMQDCSNPLISLNQMIRTTMQWPFWRIMHL